MTSRATVRALVAALSALLLVPFWQGAEASVLTVHVNHARELVPPALAEVDPLSDQRATPAVAQAVVDAFACAAPALLATGRIPADSRELPHPPVDAPSRVLRGPPRS